MGRVSSPSFIGRQDELERLLTVFDRATNGAAGVVLIAGEAGVGKSRLVGEFAARVSAARGRALIGGSMEFALELPYAPFVEAVRPVFSAPDPASVSRVVGRARQDLARLFPELDLEAPSGAIAADPTAQSRLFEQLLGLVARLGQEAPTLIALEDLHWADASTRDLFSFLARNLTGERVVLLATYRDDELDAGHPLKSQLARLSRDRRIEQIELQPFDRRDFDNQLAAIRGPDVPPAVAARIFERSGGNAFFTEELLAAEGATDRGEIPPTVREALRSRVERLSEQAQHVLRSAAVVGRDVRAPLLLAVSGLSVEAVEGALREATREHVLSANGGMDGQRYAFRHALMQEALYAEVLPSQRARLHALVAEALTAQPSLAGGSTSGLAAELAFHWARAERWPEALAASLRAADEASSAYAFPEELRHLERVLDVTERLAAGGQEPAIDRAAIAQRAARAAERIGETRRAAELIERALANVDSAAAPVQAGGLHAQLAEYFFFMGEIERAESALDVALRLLPEAVPSRERVDALAVARVWRPVSARARAPSPEADGLLSLARLVGDPRLEARAHLVEAFVEYGSDPSEATAHLVAAREIGEALGDPELITRSIHQLGHLLDGAGRFEEAHDVFLAGAARARELGLERSLGRGMENDAAEALRQMGRWAEAEALVAAVLEELDRFGAYGTAMRHAVPGHLYVGMGRFAEAQRHLSAARDGSRGGGASGLLGHIFSGLAELAIWRAEWDEARAAVEEGLRRIGDTDDLRWIGTLAALGLRAESERAQLDRVRGRQRDVEAALAVGAALVETARRTAERAHGWAEAAGHLALAESEWAELSGAPDPVLWHEAATRWAELGQPYMRAYARFREGQSLRRRRGAKTATEEALREALRTATTIGARPLADAISTFARGERLRLELEPRSRDAVEGASGGTSMAPDPRSEFALTRREREVLALLADGRTNRQIADALYVSESTAGVHVSNILAKLGVANRVEAAALAVRLGLTGH